eukprot:4475607-Alexandrium_andersonii.AAC.1
MKLQTWFPSEFLVLGILPVGALRNSQKPGFDVLRIAKTRSSELSELVGGAHRRYRIASPLRGLRHLGCGPVASSEKIELRAFA